jgi:hypothetical protein
MTTQTFESPAAGDSGREPTALRLVRSFRHWRKGRPFPGGLLITLAGVELWLAPLSSIGVMIHEGVAGFSSVFIGALLVMFGMAIWFAPAYRFFSGVAAIMLGLIALPTVNLGGFFIGTLLALIGGALSAAWVPQPGWEAPTRRQRRAGVVAAEAREEPENESTEAPTSDLPEVEDTGAHQHPED